VDVEVACIVILVAGVVDMDHNVDKVPAVVIPAPGLRTICVE